MISHKEVLKTFYLFLVMIGVLGNGCIIYNYGFHFITQSRHKHIDLILMHLVFVNTMFIFFRGIPAVIEFEGLNYTLHDVCKMILYLQRVCPGLSLCSTCLLSGYQTIVISPITPKWVALKARCPKFLFPCCILCWILNLLIDVALPRYIFGQRNNTNRKGINKLDYCSSDPYAKNDFPIPLRKSIYITMFVAFMAITSSYMVYVLYRHHQQIQHIHNTNLTPRASPAIRGTKVILMLVSTFFLFNTTYSIFNTYAGYYQATGTWALHIAAISSMSFQAVSPFVLISSDTRILQILCGLLQRMKYSSMTPSSTISHQIAKGS